MSEPIRVLIVDDSAVIRGLLARSIESEPGLELSGTAMHGEAALALLRRKPVDVVVLDVEMPVMDGLAALEHITREFPQTGVIMASTLTSEGAETTVRALALGAAGCIAKPKATSLSAAMEQVSRELVPQIRALGRRKSPVRHPSETAAEPEPATSHRLRDRTGQPHFSPKVVVVGASTGGPRALSQLLAALPTDFPLPIVIAQHMPPLFTPMLARHLQVDGNRPCREAINGEPLRSGHTYVAPGDFHLQLERTAGGVVARLSQSEPEHFCRPSVNPLFRSAASCYGPAVIAVILTGMGEDGLEGAKTVAEQGGYVIAQDEASSVVWGMPGAVVRAGLAHAVLPLARLGAAIEQYCLQEVTR